jgi:hypothetical protein
MVQSECDLKATRDTFWSWCEPIESVRDPERMGRAFIRAFGQSPQSLRRAARAP